MKVLLPSRHWIILVIFFAYPAGKSIAQCNPPEQLPTVACEDAPLVCLLNACYETLGESGTGPSGWCGPNTSIQNPQYFDIIPTAPDIEIHIHVDNCESGSSLQSGIMAACPWTNADVLACNAGTGPGGTMVLTATGLTVGETYWLMIDGFSGAFCNYTITYTENIFSPGLGEELETAFASPTSVCVGYDDLLLTADPPIPLAHGYYWVLGWSGDTITSTLPYTTVGVPGDVEPGTYEICVRAFSGCDTTDNDLCFEVDVFEIPPEEKEPAIFCPEEFPFSWHSVSIGGEGEYMVAFEDADGCSFDSIWMVESYPVPEVGLVDTLHCLPLGETIFVYEGVEYEEAGIYDLHYEHADVNGCDSMAELDLTLIGFDAVIEFSCANGDFILQAFPQHIIPINADVDYYWYQGGTQIAEGNPLETLLDGCFDLWVHLTVPEGTCEYFVETFCFDGDDYYPPPPIIGFIDTMICAQDSVFFYVIPDPDGEPFLEYTWSAPFDVPVFQDGSGTVEMDFTNSAGGQVCVYASGECGTGSSTCFEVSIINAPEAAFTVNPAAVCINETTVVTFTGEASSNAQVVWDFNTPTTITGSGLGPYSMSWASPGNKKITLTVIEPGCDTSVHTELVSVEHLETPLINCSSTISSITFDWADVPGANGYLVSFDGGAAIPINHSDTTLSSLAPGTIIEITVTAVSGGACPNTTATLQCTAENCPPPLIIISGEDSTCLNTPAIIDLDIEVNGQPGNGMWAGPGIIDLVQGLFDPTITGPGQHQLTYTGDLDGCPYNASHTITVFDSITADFVIDPIICISEVANLQYTGNASTAGTAQFLYDFGTATVAAGTGAGPYQLSWNTPGQKTVRLQVLENGCMSDVITHTTDVIAELVPPVVPCAPNTSGVVFSWTIDPAATNSMVNVLSGHSGTLAGNTYTFTGLVAGNIVQIEIVSISAGPCPSRRDTFACEARECPPVMLAIAPVDDICLYPGTGTVELVVTITNENGGVGEWSGPGVTDIVNGTFNPVLAGSGAHLITYHYREDGCDFYETITINVYDIPAAFISTTDLIITCTSGPIILDGSGSTGPPLAYLWTTDGFIGGAADGPTAAAEQPGSYQLLVTNSISGCKDSTSVDVTQDDNIPTADAGEDKTITCTADSFTIGGASTTGVNVIYTWVASGGGNVTGSTTTMTTTANSAGAYTLTVRDTATGCESDDQMVIGIDTMLASINLTAGDTIDCNTTTSTASATLNEPLGDYTFAWTTSDGLIVGDTTGAFVEVSQGGTYTLTITNKRNGCQTSASVDIAESDEIIDAVNVLQTNVTCFGDDDGSLTIESVEGGGPDYTYSWSVGATGTALTLLAPGAYSVTVTDQNGCAFVREFAITEPPQVSIEIGQNQTVQAQDSVKITFETNVPADAIAEIVWGGYDGIFCPGCPVFEFIATSSATISVSIQDTSGCSAIDSLRLTVIVPRIIYIPNVFSPNGDGINDFFTIYGRFNLVQIGFLRIFDRWGNQLFEKKELTPGEPSIGWDGMFNSEPVQSGVYVFSTELVYEDGYREVVTGNITVVR